MNMLSSETTEILYKCLLKYCKTQKLYLKETLPERNTRWNFSVSDTACGQFLVKFFLQLKSIKK